ncbi:MAG TPA: signal peptidase I [Candidatus Enterenecus avicola]|nr:signal peptidase I [Candidatus Enterenecus avicola]
MDEQWQDSQPTPSAPEAPDNLGVPELTGGTDVTGLTEDTAAKAAANRTRKDTSLGYELYLNVRTLVFVLAALILVFTFVVRIIVVSGSSMENTLQDGDSMLVWCLGYEPKQGDVVVLTQRSYQNDSLVKRVIATEGQRVDINYETGTVYVDGTALEEDYIKETMRVPSYGEGLNHVTVPEGCIFVMGDNRNDSADSRYPSIGIIDNRSVIGRAVMVVFPFPDFNLL